MGKVMKKKKEHVLPENEKNILYDFGFGAIDPKKSDFETLARGIGLDPVELARVIDLEKDKKK
jgi:hypothetical protein